MTSIMQLHFDKKYCGMYGYAVSAVVCAGIVSAHNLRVDDDRKIMK